MVKLGLGRVQVRCAVQGCTRADEQGAPLDRHHIRSQKLFVHAFRDRDSRKYRSFKRRYEQFHEDDLCRICRFHHDLVHLSYKLVIGKHARRLGKPLWQWSWKQANILMDELERTFWQWKKTEEARLASVARTSVQR